MSKLILLISCALVFLAIACGSADSNVQVKAGGEATATPIRHLDEPLTLSQSSYEIKQRLVKTDKSSGDLVLAQSGTYKVTYMISADQFMVFVETIPFDSSKAAAEQWFLDQGFVRSDLCILKISVTATKQVAPDFSAKDAIPTNCTATPTGPSF